MSELYSFYNSLLNIRKFPTREIISKIVKEEKEILLKNVTDVDGFCRYIGIHLEDRLNQAGIKTTPVDLGDFTEVDHFILIAEYWENEIIKKVLIAPTFQQFQKNPNKTLIKLASWPSEKIENKTLINELLLNGLVDIDNNKFNQYLNGFTNEEVSIDLDKYLLEKRLNSLSRK